MSRCHQTASTSSIAPEARRQNGSPLHVRSREQVEARALADISLAYAPFFSPDSRWIGFFDSTEIKKVALAGGPVITLGPVPGRSLGASWGDDNTIVFATDDPGTGLWSVSADGGEPTVLTRPEAARGESDHQFPFVLPDRRGVLFTIVGHGEAGDSLVAVLDLKTVRGKAWDRGSEPQYVDDSSGAGQVVPSLRGGRHAARRAVRSGANRGAERSGDGCRRADDQTERRRQLRGVAKRARPCRTSVGGTEPDAVACLGGSAGPRGARQGGTYPPLWSTTHIARRDTHRDRRPLIRAEPISRSGTSQRRKLTALDLRFRHEWTGGVDTRQPADRLHVRPHRRAEPVQPGCRFHRYRPTDYDERELPLAHLDHARWRRHSSASNERHGRSPRDVVAFPLTAPTVRPGSGGAGGLGPPPAKSAIRVSGAFGEVSPDGQYLAYRVGRIRAGARSTCGRSRRWIATAGRSRRVEGHEPCGRGMASSCSISTKRVR